MRLVFKGGVMILYSEGMSSKQRPNLRASVDSKIFLTKSTPHSQTWKSMGLDRVARALLMF